MLHSYINSNSYSFCNNNTSYSNNKNSKRSQIGFGLGAHNCILRPFNFSIVTGNSLVSKNCFKTHIIVKLFCEIIAIKLFLKQMFYSYIFLR